MHSEERLLNHRRRRPVESTGGDLLSSGGFFSGSPVRRICVPFPQPFREANTDAGVSAPPAEPQSQLSHSNHASQEMEAGWRVTSEGGGSQPALDHCSKMGNGSLTQGDATKRSAGAADAERTLTLPPVSENNDLGGREGWARPSLPPGGQKQFSARMSSARRSRSEHRTTLQLAYSQPPAAAKRLPRSSPNTPKQRQKKGKFRNDAGNEAPADGGGACPCV